MIDSIRGILVEKTPTFVILDVGGIRFRIHTSISTYESLPGKSTSAELLTYLHVREDILDLYGFSRPEERHLFLLLITISGIGPRSAMTILSGTNPEEFKQRISGGDLKSLTVIPGIGPKTAKRIIVELTEKLVDTAEEEYFDFLEGPDRIQVSDTVQALMSLGFKRGQVHKVLRDLEQAGELTGSIEETIKKALTKL